MAMTYVCFVVCLSTSGYIPRRPFKFGDTYKVDCDYCIDEHLSNMTTRRKHEIDLLQNVRSFNTLRPISQDPTVRDHLNTYRDSHPARPTLQGLKRCGGLRVGGARGRGGRESDWNTRLIVPSLSK